MLRVVAWGREARSSSVIDSIVGNGYLEMQGSGSYSRSFDRQEALYTVVIHRYGSSAGGPA